MALIHEGFYYQVTATLGLLLFIVYPRPSTITKLSRNRYPSHHKIYYSLYKTTDIHMIVLSIDSDEEKYLQLSNDLG